VEHYVIDDAIYIISGADISKPIFEPEEDILNVRGDTTSSKRY